MDPESEKLEALSRRIEQAGGHALVPKPVGQVRHTALGVAGDDSYRFCCGDSQRLAGDAEVRRLSHRERRTNGVTSRRI